MKWKNLEQNKCPSCSKEFLRKGRSQDGMIICLCGWSIAIEKYKSLVEQKIKQRVKLPNETN